MSEHKMDKSIGQIFKEMRLAKNIGLEQASKHTRIHPNILKAIESDDVRSLGAVYAKSFVKLYAEYLGLDKDDMARRFQASFGQEEAAGLKKVRIPGDQGTMKLKRFSIRSLKWLVLMSKRINYKYLIAFLLALVVVFGFVQWVKHQRGAPAVSQKVESTKTSEPASPSKRMPESTEAKTVTSAAVSKIKVETKAAKIPEKIILVVKAKEKCWLQVKVDGKIVFRNVLVKGSAESWQANEKIELWVGNAGGIQLELNGRLLEKIGRPRQMLKNVVVTRAGLSIER